MTHTNVLIAIQARSNSTRFPKKIYENIGDLRVLDHVIDKANSAADHVNRFTTKMKIRCQVAVLHPVDDWELVKTFRSSRAMLIGGPEDDVLTRYVLAQEQTNADYVVRLTSDCPLILDFIIAKHIHVAAFNQYDYVSNVEESCRTIADGFDCEVISKNGLAWLDQFSDSAEDREHVTTLIRRLRPDHLKQAFVAFKLDSSHMKMSVDTKEDIERIRAYYHDLQHKNEIAEHMFGKDKYAL
jgi:spore coat polysaccharide biosynthesis protein SpsF